MRKANKANVISTVKPYDEDGRLWAELGGGPIEILPLAPPRFDEPNAEAINYFKEHGYVVMKGANPAELVEAEKIFWESAGRWYGVHQDKIQQWGDDAWTCVGATRTGVVSNDSSGHSPFMWYIRGLPRIKEIYAALWQTEDLLVSFDGYGVFRPPELYGQTRAGWFHLDQNGKNKPGLHCAQGLLNVYPSGPHDGGLVVVPGSHLKFDGWFRDKLISTGKSDFVPLSKMNMRDLWGAQPVKICLEPGDFVLWDSRTSHCNHPAQLIPGNYPKRLRRLVAYVCMTPSQKAANLKLLRTQREEAFQTGTTLNHWPHEYHPHPTDFGGSGKFTYKPVPLNEHQMGLLTGVSTK